jgi:hypothetical protein
MEMVTDDYKLFPNLGSNVFNKSSIIISVLIIYAEGVE